MSLLHGFEDDEDGTKLDKAVEEKMKERNRNRALRRQEKEAMYRDLGLVKGKDSMGRTLWE